MNFPLVNSSVGRMSKASIAIVTLQRFASCMRSDVRSDFTFASERLVALGTQHLASLMNALDVDIDALLDIREPKVFLRHQQNLRKEVQICI